MKKIILMAISSLIDAKPRVTVWGKSPSGENIVRFVGIELKCKVNRLK